MKTSSISLRVADFLKQNPPFDLLEPEQLLLLAGSGRVKFHEGDETVFQTGEPRSAYFYVIQQGTVNLYRQGKSAEELFDVRVEGDILGIQWGDNTAPYSATARTVGDTILYALPLELFTQISDATPALREYLEDYFCEAPRHRGPQQDGSRGDIDKYFASWLSRVKPVNDRAANRLLTFFPHEPIREVARRLAPGLQEAIVAVDEHLRPLGIITESDFSARVATGEVSVDAPAARIMHAPVFTVRPGLSAGELILIMLRHRLHHLVVTADGSTGSKVIGIISEKSIQTLHGTIPTFLAKEIPLAENAAELAVLRSRADQVLLFFLEGEAPILWLSDFIVEVDNALCAQAVVIAKAHLKARGITEPDGLRWCWMAMHSEGRRERLLRSAQRTALVYADPQDEKQARAFEHYMAAFANEVSALLAPSGFAIDPRGRSATDPQWRLSLSQWKARYSEWVSRPEENNILRLTSFFDLRPVTGDTSLTTELREHLRNCIGANPAFIPLLAAKAMSNLPPVTIFRDSVLDQSGALSERIDTKFHLLLPLVDIARVFALACAQEASTFTPERFRLAGKQVAGAAELFEEAADAFNFAIALQTLFGLRRGDLGQHIKPDELTRAQIQRCKAVFRTLARLMEFTAGHFSAQAGTPKPTDAPLPPPHTAQSPVHRRTPDNTTVS